MSRFVPEEFRTSYHRELNNERPRLVELVEITDKLQKSTPDRKLITSLEGDIIVYKDKIYFAHILYADIANTYSMFQNKFSVQKAQGKAAEFDDVISYLKKANNSGPIELHVELKDSLKYDAIKEVDDALKSTNIPYCYLSYYGNSLDDAKKINKDIDTVYIRLCSINDNLISLFPWNKPKIEPSINAIPPTMIMGNMTIPRLHGVVRDKRSIKKFAEDPNVRGICTEYELLKEHKRIFLF